jgi:hypothetical protein
MEAQTDRFLVMSILYLSILNQYITMILPTLVSEPATTQSPVFT